MREGNNHDVTQAARYGVCRCRQREATAVRVKYVVALKKITSVREPSACERNLLYLWFPLSCPSSLPR